MLLGGKTFYRLPFDTKIVRIFIWVLLGFNRFSVSLAFLY